MGVYLRRFTANEVITLTILLKYNVLYILLCRHIHDLYA
jgi:hypothetical protein